MIADEKDFVATRGMRLCKAAGPSRRSKHQCCRRDSTPRVDCKVLWSNAGSASLQAHSINIEISS